MQELPNLAVILAVVATALAARLIGGRPDVVAGVSGVRGPRSGTGATGAPDPRGPRAQAGGGRDPGRVQGDGSAALPFGRLGTAVLRTAGGT
jgi:hypothetical protein